MKNSNNPELQLILDWFLSFIKPTEWLERKREIEKYLDITHRPKKSYQNIINHESISFPQHNKGLKISWYLYLIETLLIEPTKYEPHQGARIIPIFERLGTDFELLQQIGGIDKKIKELLFSKENMPDQVLFEILVALLWKRNGWENVSFIPEAPPEKRPDIRAASENNEWIIECKRLNGSSKYSEKEQKEWLRMWRCLRDYLID
jgi:hypothetical protein